MGRLDFLDLAEGLGVFGEALFLDLPCRGLLAFAAVLGSFLFRVSALFGL